jgi:hypothetical protein
MLTRSTAVSVDGEDCSDMRENFLKYTVLTDRLRCQFTDNASGQLDSLRCGLHHRAEGDEFFFDVGVKLFRFHGH